MTPNLPSITVWLQILVLTAIVAARHKWCDEKPSEKILNPTLVMMLAIELLTNPLVERLTDQYAHIPKATDIQIALCVLSFASGDFLSGASLWAGYSVDEAHKLRRRCRIINIPIAVLLFTAGAQSRQANTVLQESKSFESILALAASYTLIAYLTGKLLWMCVAELKRPRARVKESAALVFMVVICGEIMAACCADICLQALDAVGVTNTGSWRFAILSNTWFWDETGVLALASISLANTILARLGLDCTSLKLRRIRGLRESMLTAFPEHKLAFTSVQSRRGATLLELHRSVIEIHDSFLQLRPYFTALEPSLEEGFLRRHSVPRREEELARIALRLAFALQRKSMGQSVDCQVLHPIEISSGSLYEETLKLVTISTWWDSSCNFATQHVVSREHASQGKPELQATTG